MTVYTCDIYTSPANANGETTTSISTDRINDTGSNFASSDDFGSTGPSVLDGQTGARRSVLSEADLQATDIVEVAGVPMTVAQARAAGVKISVDATASEAVTPKAPDDDTTDTADAVDQRAADDGRATDAEIVAMDNVVAAVAMHTGLDQEATIELGKDILTGELPQDDVIWTGLQNRGVSKDAAVASVQQVVSVGQAAAMRELGQNEYDELNRLAGNSAAIKDLVIDHGIKRMTGRTKGVTWKHIVALARHYARA